MPFQHAHVGLIQTAARGRYSQRQRGLGGHSGRLVQQQRGWLGRRKHRIGCQRYLRRGGQCLWLLDHHTVHADPAAFDVLLSLATRAAEQRGNAFVETDRFGHRTSSASGHGSVRAGSVDARGWPHWRGVEALPTPGEYVGIHVNANESAPSPGTHAGFARHFAAIALLPHPTKWETGRSHRRLQMFIKFGTTRIRLAHISVVNDPFNAGEFRFLLPLGAGRPDLRRRGLRTLQQRGRCRTALRQRPCRAGELSARQHPSRHACCARQRDGSVAR